MLYQISRGSKAFGTETVFEDIQFEIRGTEKIAVVGRNGCGKSTLLKIMTGELELDKGEIHSTSGTRIGYLAQTTFPDETLTVREDLEKVFEPLQKLKAQLDKLTERMATDYSEAVLDRYAQLETQFEMAGGYTWQSELMTVFTKFGFQEEMLDRIINTFSGGQKTRLAFVKLLLSKPDILLLDEPTNYLDEQHIRWLKTYLQNYENAFILISHDMPFTNEVVNLIYHMENCRLTRYVGNVDEFHRLYEQNKLALEAAYQRQQQEIARMEDFVARNKARVATRGMANSRAKKLAKMERIELSAEKPKPTFRFQMGKTPGKVIFSTSDLMIGYDEPLSKPINRVLEKGQKVVITGANGLGKTTLMKSLMGLIPPVSGSVQLGEHVEIGYFEQEITEPIRRTCIEELWQTYPAYSQYEIRSALARCGLTTDQIESQVMVLSGGEQAKLRLCKLLNTPYNVLFLDEPTNHLDQDAKDELHKAIAEYPGTVLLVCHEKEFYSDLADAVWDLSEVSLRR